MGELHSRNVSLSYSGADVIRNMELRFPPGQISVLIGSNGCGKSTLLRALARLMKPKHGAVLLDGHEIAKMPAKEVARQLAFLPQGPTLPEGLTVHQLVRLGRYPYQRLLQQWSEKDESAVREALARTGMQAFAERPVDLLSGGQKQRAWIAMTLAQDTDLLLLDEPTTYLDLTHQVEILDLLYEMNAKEGRTIIMVLHDLNLACRYAHHMIAVCEQSLYAQGPPEEIMTKLMIRDVFGMECDIMADPLFGTAMCIPHGKGRMIKKEECGNEQAGSGAAGEQI